MPDINLLQNNHPQKAPEGGAVPHSLNYIGAVIFVVVVLLSAGVWYLAANAKQQEQTLTAQVQTAKQQIVQLPNYSSFVREQSSLQALSFLLQNHLDWSQPATNIAGVTLKTAQYTSITINQDGTGTLEGTVPNYADLDRYLLALNTKALSPFIASATLENVSTAGSNANSGLIGSTVSSSASGLSFTVDITFDKSLWSSSASK